MLLDHQGQNFPVQYRVQVLKDVLSKSIGTYHVCVNKTHFGKISLEELKQFSFDIYAAGNLEVIKHIAGLEVPTLYVPRSFEYEAGAERLAAGMHALLTKGGIT